MKRIIEMQATLLPQKTRLLSSLLKIPSSPCPTR